MLCLLLLCGRSHLGQHSSMESPSLLCFLTHDGNTSQCVLVCPQLWHWVKCHKDGAGNVRPADSGEYQFAKYNKKVSPRTPAVHIPR